MKHVLIVDDKAENLYYLEALLKGQGCAVDVARHGAEALVMARQHPPDLVISDLLMPVMDGYTLLRHWKADERLRGVPFIVYTATYTEAEDERLALSLGADAFLLKPAEPEDFLARIREVQAKSTAGNRPAPPSTPGDEKELLKVYSETLIRKLEEKMLQLEEANRALQQDIAARKLAEQEKQELLTREQAARREADAASRYYRSLFECAPGCYLVLTPDDYEIVAVSDAYLRATMTTREQLQGQRVFDAFPDDPNEPDADGTKKLRASLERVKSLGRADVMGVQRYPIRRPAPHGGGFEERYWSPVNTPVPGPDGKIAFIIHRVEDVTEYVRYKQRSGREAEALQALESRTQFIEADIILRSHELRRANEQLAQSAALLRIAGQAAKLGGWSLDLADRRITWSDETRAIHEAAADYQPTLEEGIRFYAPEHRPQITHAVEACIRDGTPFDLELQIITAKGRRVWVRAVGEAVHDEADRIVRLQGAFQDITEQKAADAKLHESEERFRLLSKATNDAIWDWDLVTNLLWWNEGFESLFGFQRHEVEPTIDSWYNRVHPEDKDAIIADVHRTIETGQASWSGEYRFRCADGSYAYVLDRGHVIRDPHGKPVRMVGGMTDLTERRLAEEKLREQATLLDKAQDAILVRDLDDRVTYWNKSAERLYGWTAAEAIGRPIQELVYRTPEAFLAATQVTLQTGEWVGEIEQYTKAGTRLIIEGRWSLVRDDQGNPKSILAINTDITRRKQIETQMLRTQRMESIGTLASGIAHDLNNVLTPIMMSVEFLRTKIHDDDTASALETLRVCSQRGADLVKQVLFFGRGVEGQRLQVNPAKVLREIQKIVRDTFPKSIECTFSSAPELWMVTGDPTQLHQVMLNLCVNARDAMPNGGILTVTLGNVVLDEVFASANPDSKPGNYVILEVADTGAGIAPAIRDRIFEPFFTTKETGKGTGLGLSTTLAIVKSHGGFIALESEPAQGTRFCVYLPAETASPAKQADGNAPTALPRGNGELVLVVDDEASLRNVAQKTLERFGYRVLLAGHGAEAVSLYVTHREQIAAVITDMAMPVMDGANLVIALKTINPDARIIVSSGLAAEGSMQKAVDAGVKHFIPKPYTAQTLLNTLHELLQARAS